MRAGAAARSTGVASPVLAREGYAQQYCESSCNGHRALESGLECWPFTFWLRLYVCSICGVRVFGLAFKPIAIIELLCQYSIVGALNMLAFFGFSRHLCLEAFASNTPLSLPYASSFQKQRLWLVLINISSTWYLYIHILNLRRSCQSLLPDNLLFTAPLRPLPFLASELLAWEWSCRTAQRSFPFV